MHKLSAGYSPLADGQTVIECYDYLGRRYMKKVTRNGVVTKHERYIYRGYRQIAALDQKRAAHPALWYVLWDPTESVATRPLAIQKDGAWYTYGHDLTKNVWELYKANGTIASTYDYAPFGGVTANGTAEQPFQWSSEFYDSELGMVYYNFRFYNPSDGRWISRDIVTNSLQNRYDYIHNNPLSDIDLWGAISRTERDAQRKSRNATNSANRQAKKSHAPVRNSVRYYSIRGGTLGDALLEIPATVKDVGRVFSGPSGTINQVINEGLMKCYEYLNSHPDVRCACCSIGINSHNTTIGGRDVVEYTLQSAVVNPNVSCQDVNSGPSVQTYQNLIEPLPLERAISPMKPDEQVIVEPKFFDIKYSENNKNQ